MVNKPFAVFPGSFDPFTLAHYELAFEASKFFKVIILICHNPGKSSGMFTPNERKNIITYALSGAIGEGEFNAEDIAVDVCYGLVSDYCEQNNISHVIRGIQYKNAAEELDLASIYYDDAKIKTLFFPTYSQKLKCVSSTRIREYIKNNNKQWKRFVPSEAVSIIQTYINNTKRRQNKI